ncbi:hypothetical protein GCM10010326_72130 [Streptomyces xanthochromogenes]|uniref:Transposase n=1 Tax=Streptomyces xanthochromogenes TaxID=67384 RepID=A0ABQ3AV91_9ACTN|nr:hypothetical protein GCM10010326_72130 [Streptomyces xanthochromogenes]
MLADLHVPDAAFGDEAADEALADAEAFGGLGDAEETISHGRPPPPHEGGAGGRRAALLGGASKVLPRLVGYGGNSNEAGYIQGRVGSLDRDEGFRARANFTECAWAAAEIRLRAFRDLL